MSVSRVQCVILASGFSRRFSSDKLLYPLPNGNPLIVETLSNYQRVFENIVVVVRPDNTALVSLLKSLKGIRLLFNEAANLGMSQAIVKVVDDSVNGTGENTDLNKGSRVGWLFALADMPYISSTTIQALAELAESGNIVQPTFKTKSGKSKSGNPVFIGRHFRQELLSLSGDVGAKPILKQHADKILRVESEDEGILWDIDYLEDIRDSAKTHSKN